MLFSQAFLGVLTRLFLPQKIKIAGIIHDAMSLAPNKKTHYSRKSFWLHQLTQRPLEILANYILDFTVGNSKFIQKLILEKRRLAVDRVPMIYQSIDVSKIQFQPIEWQYKQGESLKILFVKSGFVGGGLEDLITALGSLSYHFHLAVIGPNPSVQPIIKNWAKNFSNISLHCMGLLMQSEVLSAMSSHHILCIPSRHEAFGLANVEGLANGISVVSTKIGGIPEVLDNGRCGWLAESNNPHSLSLVLKACIESPPSVRLEKSNYGRQHVEKLFSKKEMLEEFINLFEEMTV